MTDRVPAPEERASLQHANDESRERLVRLAAMLTPTQLRVDLGEGWTVASALAHTGFWDRWQAERWTDLLAGTWSASDESMLVAEHLANEALHPYWSGIEAGDIPALAVEAATRVDALIAAAPDAMVESLEGTPAAYLLHRHRHRTEHIEHIERSLAAAGLAAATPKSHLSDRSFNERNRASRARLVALAGRVTPADLARHTSPTEEGSWTVGQVFGHLAFWDRFLASRWRAALATGAGNGPRPMPEELADLLNSALEPSIGAFAGASGNGFLREVVAAAEAIDELIAGLPAEAPIEMVLAERPNLLDRSTHRASHMDTIDQALGV